MNAAAQKQIDFEATEKRAAQRKRNLRDNKLRRQSVHAILIHERVSHDRGPLAIVGTYDDALEYARLILRTEDVVLLDQWHHVIENPEGRRYFSNPPMGFAEAEHVVDDKRYRYVPYEKVRYALRTIRAATFRDLEPPTCGPAKRVDDGVYSLGPKDAPKRFTLTRSGRGSKVSWDVKDAHTGLRDHYNSRKRDAVARANRILRVEHTRLEIASEFTDPDRF